MGEVFAGRFELLDPIASGGMGSVWQVLDRRDSQVYAGKLLRQSDSASLLRFMREQGTRIHHPHVVTPVSWAGEDDRVLFTMPLVRGGSVANLLRDHGPLPARWVVEILAQALDGLSAVHAQRLVHRDVKPANLLLEATGYDRPLVRLTDFGLAASMDEPRMTRASMVLGTPGYMSPEQLRGGDPEPAQDLYAIGRCGLEMLTGTRPENSVEAARQRAQAEPAYAPLVDLLVRSVDDDPAQRPGSAQEFRARLLAVETWESQGHPPFVRDQIGAGPVQPAFSPTPAFTGVLTRESGATGRPAPRQPMSQRQRLGVLLLVVGALCALGSGWLLLG